MQRVKRYLHKFIADINEEVVEELYAKFPQGKMLRSKLILAISKDEMAPFLAAIVEMIHAASLLHDDVIDDATQRRGVTSINAIYGNKNAIMLGDILYSKAFFELSKLPDPIPQVISNAVTLLSIGELLDVKLSQAFNPSQESYFDMIYKKTGSLIEASARSAALLSQKEASSYALFGKNLGIAFQIVDDILDITQDSATLGKPAMSDFKEGKTTLPYIYLYEALDERGKEYLMSLFKKELSAQEEEWIKEQMQKSGALKRAKEKARQVAYEGAQAVRENNLHAIMEALVERTY